MPNKANGSMFWTAIVGGTLSWLFWTVVFALGVAHGLLPMWVALVILVIGWATIIDVSRRYP